VSASRKSARIMPRTRIDHGIFVKSNFSPCFGIGV
jgi:hypothetical protein